MTHRRGLLPLGCTVALIAAGLGGLPTRAVAAAYTGTGGGPETTFNAPYRSPVGQTLPPGRAAAPEIDPGQRTLRQKNLDRVLDSICDGC